MPADFDSEGKLRVNGVVVPDETPEKVHISDEEIGRWYAYCGWGHSYSCPDVRAATKLASNLAIDRGIQIAILRNGDSILDAVKSLASSVRALTKELRKMTEFWGEIRDEYVKQRAEDGC